MLKREALICLHVSALTPGGASAGAVEEEKGALQQALMVELALHSLGRTVAEGLLEPASMVESFSLGAMEEEAKLE
jgi:hypothetical protein